MQQTQITMTSPYTPFMVQWLLLGQKHITTDNSMDDGHEVQVSRPHGCGRATGGGRAMPGHLHGCKWLKTSGTSFPAVAESTPRVLFNTCLTGALPTGRTEVTEKYTLLFYYAIFYWIPDGFYARMGAGMTGEVVFHEERRMQIQFIILQLYFSWLMQFYLMMRECYFLLDTGFLRYDGRGGVSCGAAVVRG